MLADDLKRYARQPGDPLRHKFVDESGYLLAYFSRFHDQWVMDYPNRAYIDRYAHEHDRG